jgi:hypothetical protein
MAKLILIQDVKERKMFFPTPLPLGRFSVSPENKC